MLGAIARNQIGLIPAFILSLQSNPKKSKILNLLRKEDPVHFFSRIIQREENRGL